MPGAGLPVGNCEYALQAVPPKEMQATTTEHPKPKRFWITVSFLKEAHESS